MGKRTDLEDRAMDETTLPLDRDRVDRIVLRQKFDLRRASIREMNRLVERDRARVRHPLRPHGVRHPRPADAPLAIEAERRGAARAGRRPRLRAVRRRARAQAEAARFVKLFMDVDVPPDVLRPDRRRHGGLLRRARCSRAGMHAERRTRALPRAGLPGEPAADAPARPRAREPSTSTTIAATKLLDAVERARGARRPLRRPLVEPEQPELDRADRARAGGLGAHLRPSTTCSRSRTWPTSAWTSGATTSTPGRPPYQPTVLRYTRPRASRVISSSKIFSYAGQRIALAILSPELIARSCRDLAESLRHAPTSVTPSCTACSTRSPPACPQSPQYGLLALLRAANDGDRERLRARAGVRAARARS